MSALHSLSLACSCGISYEVLASSGEIERRLRAAWDAYHEGEGHRPCSILEAWEVRERRQAAFEALVSPRGLA